MRTNIKIKIINNIAVKLFTFLYKKYVIIKSRVKESNNAAIIEDKSPALLILKMERMNIKPILGLGFIKPTER